MWLAVLVLVLGVMARLPAAAQSPSPAASASGSPAASASGAPAASASGSPAASASGSPAASASGSPAASAPTSTPIPLSIVVEKVEAVRSTLEKITSHLGEDPEIDAIGSQAEALRKQLYDFTIHTEKIIAKDDTLDTLQGLLSDLRGMCEPVDGWTRALAARSAAIEADAKMLIELEKVWTQTLQAVVDGGAPQDVVDSVRQICDRIATIRAQQDKWMRKTLSLQNRVAEISATGDDMSQRLAQAGVYAARRMLKRDAMPLWSPLAWECSGSIEAGVGSAEHRLTHVAQYMSFHKRGIAGHMVVVLVLFVLFSVTKRAFTDWGGIDDPTAMAVVRVPLAAAYVLSILSMVAFYPSPPRFFTFVIIISAILAALVVMGPTVNRHLRVLPYALLAVAVLDTGRALLISAVFLFRVGVLIEQVTVLTFLVWLLRSGRLAAAENEVDAPVRVHLIKLFVYTSLVGFSGALMANVCGYVNLCRNLQNLTVAPLYLFLLLYATLRLLDALAIYFMRVWPLSRLASVKNNRDSLRGVLRGLVLVVALGLWTRYVVSQMPTEATIIARFNAVMDADIGLGGATPLGIIMFLVVVMASFGCSRLLLALLEEDVYPRFSLPSGVPFAISTMLHYVLVLMGFLVALGMLGVDMSRFTLMVSAFGVGLGFGLQTIVNNLVSGIILLFERPVKIGDVIEMNNNRGVLTHIGLRASVLHASDGSDIILPNGTLLSSNVVNYTLADQQRRIEIEVQIPAGYDADKVMAMLIAEARKVDHVLTDPPPECLFMKFTDKQLVLQVRAWVSTTERWRSVRSSLNLAIYGTLLREGIVASILLPSDVK